ncbi:predicted protein [Aspergillus nidulans FGSC A4]|uniref:BZIP domain-containing protein n=1 Tax=Emericella nidulans (strain FGSC A4 / ATCC 38163 / CBS 112.46 / NRRL 194 / M139) TaxID=227321 RepID=Q5BFD2_EMENI|nr:hypothetical protein [Aspergillus nidulans FGSC A4]EAA65390.1 predicted protein [Aspergillus nidulans FGSC A4]CBF88861.1 TPA: conserved hypothetical protein [Aspergillus nidulans FGSC A4]|eukprot:XP_658352.1 predicted protein [Aspergillus nidulans FGSC A4]
MTISWETSLIRKTQRILTYTTNYCQKEPAATDAVHGEYSPRVTPLPCDSVASISSYGIEYVVCHFQSNPAFSLPIIISNTMQNFSKQDRKRAQDRAAQRASRTRIKDWLARLEFQIAQLQGGADQALLKEVNCLRQERSQLRTLTDQFLNVAGAVHITLDPMDDGLGVLSRQSRNPRPNLLSNIIQDLADKEKLVQRLMANLHRSLILERPLVRLIDQLAILYLAQMSLLPDVVSYDTKPCNDFATAILRNLLFVPEINFEDAYIVDADHRLTLSPRFSQLFSPGAPMPPFAVKTVNTAFLGQYPALRELVPEWQAHDHVSQPHKFRPKGSQNITALPNQSRPSGSSAGDDQQRLERLGHASPGLLEGKPSVDATQNVSAGTHRESPLLKWAMCPFHPRWLFHRRPPDTLAAG